MKGDIIKKSLVAASIVGVVGITSLAGVGLASAQSNTNSGTGLVDKIAQKFNLNKSDVQKVFDEDHASHEAARQQKMDDRLTQAVKDGKLTQTQADAIKAKMQELKTYMDSLKDKTEQERHDAMKTKMEELKQWVTSNGIPEQFVPFGHGPGMGHGPMMRGPENSNE